MGIGSILSGALSGLSAGGPVGAGVGAAAGLLSGFGNDPSQTTTVNLRDFSSGELEIVRALEAEMPGLINSLDPANQKALISRYSTMLRTQGRRSVREGFSNLRREYKLDTARTGGSLGSIDLYNRAESARAEAKAMSDVDVNAALAAEQIAGSRTQQDLSRLGTMSGVLGNMHGLRAIGAGQTTTTSGGEMMGPMSLLGYAATSEDSWIRRQFSGEQED